MVLTLVYPAAASNAFKKYYICYRLQQKLQDKHNIWGQKFKDGLITEAEWIEFQDMWYNPRTNLVTGEILRLRGLAKNKDWSINLDNVFVEE